MNKFTTLKSAFLEAFEKTGGADGLVDWIKKSPANRERFYQMVTRLFPQEVAHSGPDGAAEIILKVVHLKGEDGNGGNGGEKK